ncbi:MAG: hypothetical protein E7667_00340 [Ruminococcaceae bacterium]|nr:hypothetical protein [Oscillospiraceae bacterium]
MNISYCLSGYVKIYIADDQLSDFMNTCLKHNLPYSQGEVAEGGACFLIRLRYLKIFETLCSKENIRIDVRIRGGLPVWLYGKRKRYGLIVGLFCAVALVIMARLFIWRIDVVGNQSMTSAQVLECLKSHGLFAGSYIPKLDTDKMQNRILIDSDEIAWISININGNTACVEIKERDMAQQEQQSSAPANLVASKAGRIAWVQIMQGNIVVREGDIVQQGELLVSGLFDSKLDGFRVTRAQGKIYAETSEEFYIKIPYDYEAKVYTGEQYCDKYLNFFDFSVKISKNSRNNYTFYDKISTVDSYSFFDGEILPISKTTDKYLEYEILRATRTKEEAEELAYFELSQKIRELPSDTILIRKVIIPQIHEDFFALRCVIVCIENIAQTSEFEVDMIPVE